MFLRATPTALLSLSTLLFSGLASANPASSQHAPRDSSACKLQARQDVYLSSGFGYVGDCAPSTGALNGFMFFVDFPDAPATEAAPKELHDFFLPSAADWYRDASYGTLELNITADTSAFIRMPAASDSYNWQRDFTADDHEKYVSDAIAAYIAAGHVPPVVDVLYVVPTANAAAISFSPTFQNLVFTADKRQIAKKAVTFGLDAYETWGFKTLNHETGHTMCLPDLYPFDGPTGQYIGGWNMMGLISGPAPDYFAWDKWRLGWLADKDVACVAAPGTSTHILTPLAGSSGVRAVIVARTATQALVAEARTAAGLDSATCSPGVLLYTVDTTVATGAGPIRVLDANPSTMGCDGEPLNDATLNMNGTSTYTADPWGVTVSILEQTDSSFTIKVDWQ